MFVFRYKWRKNWRFSVSHLVAQLAAPVALDQVWVLQVVVVHPDHLLQVPAVRVDRVADQLVRWLAAGRCGEPAARVKTVATQLAADKIQSRLMYAPASRAASASRPTPGACPFHT